MATNIDNHTHQSHIHPISEIEYDLVFEALANLTNADLQKLDLLPSQSKAGDQLSLMSAIVKTHQETHPGHWFPYSAYSIASRKQLSITQDLKQICPRFIDELTLCSLPPPDEYHYPQAEFIYNRLWKRMGFTTSDLRLVCGEDQTLHWGIQVHFHTSQIDGPDLAKNLKILNHTFKLIFQIGQSDQFEFQYSLLK